VCDDVTTTGSQNPHLSIEKTSATVNYNAVGQTITYSITATNTGNVTIASVTITDANAVLGTCTPANGSSRAPGESITCAATHVVTQADIDAGHYLNTACVDDGAGGAAAVCDGANVPAVSNKRLTVLKTVTETSYSAIGQVLHYTVVATNGGNTTLANVLITDANATIGICTPANGSTLAPGGTISCTATHTVTQADLDAGHYLNNACVSATNATATCDDVELIVAALTVVKANDAPPVVVTLPDNTQASIPTAIEGATVTFTLSYTVGSVDLTNGTITDVLPAGLTYVDLSATNSTEFTFGSYDPATRTLSWTAAKATADGFVTYKVKVDVGAAKLLQPLRNVATIDSAETEPDSDTDLVFVPAPPKVETAPPTDIEQGAVKGQPGSSLPLILAILAAIFVTVAVVTPVPATARRRNRQR
jgi:fimbrial isopeptide formation D2 family protein